MKKYLIFGLILGLLVSSAGIGVALAAKPNFISANVANPVTGEVKNTITVPSKAVEVASGIFYLGSVIDPGSGQMVEGYAFVRYKKGYGKPSGCNNDGKCQGWESPSCGDCTGGGGEPDTSSCYTFLAKDAKWKTVEPWLVDESGSGLPSNFVASNLAGDIAKWETAANDADILGDKEAGTVDRENIGDLNGKNEVMFANIEQPNAIAITIIWGRFGGRPSNRKLVEWDQVYDNNEYDWSASGEAGKMDFENIATHELGHSVGLGDLYESTCANVTMYGYASNGETKKRTLEDGDIAGVSKLYK